MDASTTRNLIARAADVVRPGVPIYAEQLVETGGGAGVVRLSELPEAEQKILTGLVVALKQSGHGYRAIRKMTRLGSDTIQRILRVARERDELKDVLADLDMEAVPLAVDNLREFLRKPWSEQGTKATFDVLEGRGVLVKHQKTASVSKSDMTFTIKYANAPAEPPAPSGTIAASPIVD